MNLRAGISFLGLLFFIMTLSSCNIFSWTSSAEEGEDFLEEGLDFMFDGDFEAAERLFALGLLTDPLNSDLLYNHAKATLLSSGESIVTIVNELATFDQNSTLGDSLPFLGRPWPHKQNTLYRTNIVIFNDLEPIFDEKTTGSIKKEDISLDIFIANTVRGIMRIADTNGDDSITVKDIRLSFLSTADGFAFDSLSNIDPNDLNNLLSNMGNILEGGSDLLGGFLGESTIDTSAIDSLLEDITGSLDFYFVNTFIEGDPNAVPPIPDIGDSTNLGNSINGGDNDNDGFADDECLNGVDDDHDGLTDEDAIITGGWAWFDEDGPGPDNPKPRVQTLCQ